MNLPTLAGAAQCAQTHLTQRRNRQRPDIASTVLWTWLCMVFVATFALWPTMVQAQNQDATFGLSKKLCVGAPSLSLLPTSFASNALCAPTLQVAINTPVYYVITATNPPGLPPKTVTLTETANSGSLPPGFTMSGTTCLDNAGGAVPFTTSTLPVLGHFTLSPSQSVQCIVSGTFTTSGSKTNTVEGSAKIDNQPAFTISATANTQVSAYDPIGTNLKITKSANPTSVNVSSGGAIVTYSIKVENNGPADVDIGHWFDLYDTLSLAPNSVSLFATHISTTCLPVSGADCPDITPVTPPPSPTLVGSMAWKPFLHWKFPSTGTAAAGHMPQNSAFTLTVKVKIEKLPTLNCVLQANADGLRNQAFFNLTNPDGSVKSDSIATDNTAFATVPVSTGANTVDPNCGQGQLKITKKRISPPGTVSWIAPPVLYEITITNTSMPAQAITINGGDLEDWVTQGINTPPFRRTTINTLCVSSNVSGLCSLFNSSPPIAPAGGTVPAAPYVHHYYGDGKPAWTSKTSAAVTLPPTKFITIRTRIRYHNPECQTDPNTNPKHIINTAMVRYWATAVGAASGSPQDTLFTGTADAAIKMANAPLCHFKVTKHFFHMATPDTLQFGLPLNYRVTFTNAGPARTVGTVMDALRLTQPGYATSLNFSANWSCSGAPLSGTISGSVTAGQVSYTTNAAQGSPIFNLGPLYFNSGDTITCYVNNLKVDRPPYGSLQCTANETRLENIALMDITRPFNTNAFAPPTGLYNATNPANPTLGTQAWATASPKLPKCFDATVGKTATVGNLPPGSAAWTYVGNPTPIDYVITLQNTSQSNLTGSINSNSLWDGLAVEDYLNPPYPRWASQFGPSAGFTPLSIPNISNWVAQFGASTGYSNSFPPSVMGANLIPANSLGQINATFSGPYIQGVAVKNCAVVRPAGDHNGPSWYSNYDPALPPTICPQEVPVLAVTSLQVRKVFMDLTGAGIMDHGPFQLQVNCGPTYLLPTGAGNVTLTTSGGGGAATIQNVPQQGTCTVTEPGYPPIPPAADARCAAQGGAMWSTTITPFPNPLVAQPLNPLVNPNTATVTNKLICKPAMTKVDIRKVVVNADQFGSTSFPVTLSCAPPTTTITANVTPSATVTVLAPAGSTCTVTETPPPLPAGICGPGQVASWQTTYVPPTLVVPPPGQTGAVGVFNKVICSSPSAARANAN